MGGICLRRPSPLRVGPDGSAWRLRSRGDAHIIGENAAELIHTGQAVMALGGTVDYFVDAVVNYPTLSELYKIAAHNGLNRAAGASADALADLPATEAAVAAEEHVAVSTARATVSSAGRNGKKAQ
jgi:hypothetical protein